MLKRLYGGTSSGPGSCTFIYTPLAIAVLKKQLKRAGGGDANNSYKAIKINMMIVPPELIWFSKISDTNTKVNGKFFPLSKNHSTFRRLRGVRDV